MRYLSQYFAVLALRRGAQIEQFLGRVQLEDRQGIRWVEIVPRPDGFRVWVWEAEDVGDETACDVMTFPPLGQALDLEPRVLGVVDDELQAMELAHDLAGAQPLHWVNRGMVDEEYRDYVQGGRSTIAP